ncbi:MAG TPA: alpha/beta hydrolase [Nocardioides sp.]|uniref:alpha/beta fold hydrolase n=1 Tax=Nocardioides sp. TaxID=35761 RepID=UPI002BACF2B3|nr:alpha/beta hydrolase [Nocardioides sp.]HQR26936.1 alpha/beta hydrolase [Nocardioides sp.]
MSERSFIDTVVGRLAVRVEGQGAPAVLWHSLFVDERSWRRVTAELAEVRRLVTITGPGHGESSDPGGRYDLRQCARAAAEVLDALGVAEPVDWVGNAWGGHVGIRFATAYPRRTRSLVTLGTPVQPLSAAERARTHALLLAHRVLGPAGFILDGVVETMLAPATRASDPEAVALVRTSVTAADRRLLRNAVVSISLHREDLGALLPGVAVPTLMITGEQHGGWTPAQAAAAATRLPDGRVAVVPDAAYLVPLEQPGAVVELVRRFWTSAVTEAPGGRR